jgi:hypothetical protein
MKGSITPKSSILSIFSFSVCFLPYGKRLSDCFIGTALKYVFSKSKGALGHTDLVQHKINTGSAVPIKQSLRRLPYGKRQTEKEKILRMLDLGVIEPLHLVKKKFLT